MQSVVHLVRHGQVHNPDGILYGRLPGYGLSEIGRAMATRLGEYFADVPLTHLRCSPLQRARETMAPIAAKHPELEIVTEDRVIEAANVFEGRNFGRYNQVLLLPQNLWRLRNPLRPSWGEAYPSIVARVRAAMSDAAKDAGDGGQALIVMHELPIWISRLAAEGRSLVHDPRKRQCRLASVTSFTLIDDRIVAVDYAEPAADLLPAKKSKVLFRPGS
ncbi:MAG: histidine phosphatase family protein [Micropruina sp.]|uniref:histidine phosphatase family protein n=1 Tax=Micropruina sp. TaxID=2737536 RepID=UPI0039E53620